MPATSQEITRLRALTNEPTTTPYTDEMMAAAIERHPVADVHGEEPFVWRMTRPPTQEANPDWIESYDLYAAAADIWEEKAAILSQDYDFTAPRGDGSYRRSQAYEQAMRQARYYRSRRAPGVLRQLAGQSAPESPIANVNDPYA